MRDNVNWTLDMQRFLITKWQEMIVKGILDGKTKRNCLHSHKAVNRARPDL